MKCKKCRILVDKLEELIVHKFETHGYPIEFSFKELDKLINQNEVKRLLILHKQTGRGGSEMFGKVEGYKKDR